MSKTKAAALYDFWSSFGVPAFEENCVPTGDEAPFFPYITYNVSTDSFGAEVSLVSFLWYRGTSWRDANAKAEEISEEIGRDGIFLKCKGGAIWLKRGVPFAQSMGDPSDTAIKRKILNVTAEFITAD